MHGVGRKSRPILCQAALFWEPHALPGKYRPLGKVNESGRDQNACGGNSAHPYGFTKKFWLTRGPRQGHPTSGFHRISKCERNRRQAGANEDDRRIDDAGSSPSCSLLCLYRLGSRAPTIHRGVQWQAELRARCPGSGRQKINWFRAFGWRYYPGQTGLCNLMEPWTS
jgi:hypothetical protein